MVKGCSPSNDIRYQKCEVGGQVYEVRNNAELNACRPDVEDPACSILRQDESPLGRPDFLQTLQYGASVSSVYGQDPHWQDYRLFKGDRREATPQDLESIEKYTKEAIDALKDPSAEGDLLRETALNHLISHLKIYDSYVVTAYFKADPDKHDFDDDGYTRFRKIDPQVGFLLHHLDVKHQLDGLYRSLSIGDIDITNHGTDFEGLLEYVQQERSTVVREADMLDLRALTSLYDKDVTNLTFLAKFQKVRDQTVTRENARDLKCTLAELEGQLDVLRGYDSPLSSSLNKVSEFMVAKRKEVDSLIQQMETKSRPKRRK
ncbi:MAG: hypothetical protein HYU97_00605 [Deltaproteobacteria bacterium]|nr:hypothetical protein [Deltaproteobacteria bacterium]